MKYFNESLITWGDLNEFAQNKMIESTARTIIDQYDRHDLLQRFGSDEFDRDRVNGDNVLDWAYEMADKVLERGFTHWVKIDIPSVDL